MKKISRKMASGIGGEHTVCGICLIQHETCVELQTEDFDYERLRLCVREIGGDIDVEDCVVCNMCQSRLNLLYKLDWTCDVLRKERTDLLTWFTDYRQNKLTNSADYDTSSIQEDFSSNLSELRELLQSVSLCCVDHSDVGVQVDLLYINTDSTESTICFGETFEGDESSFKHEVTEGVDQCDVVQNIHEELQECDNDNGIPHRQEDIVGNSCDIIVTSEISDDETGESFSNKHVKEKNVRKGKDMKHQLKKFVCLLCDQRFDKDSLLQKHIKVRHDKNKPHACSECHRTYTTKYMLQGHIEACHTGEARIKCDVCGKGFHFKSHLRSHYKSHTKELRCGHCGKGFGDRRCLKKHVRRYHDEEGGRSDVVSEIKPEAHSDQEYGLDDINHGNDPDPALDDDVVKSNRTISDEENEDNQKWEVNSNTQIFPDGAMRSGQQHDMFVCSMCSKGFPKPYLLQKHIKSHHDKNKPHACTECHVTYTTKYMLKGHIEIHHKGKSRFKCDVCGKGFHYKSYLRNHYKYHTKDLKCEHCGKGFGDQRCLVDHVKRYHDEIGIYPNETKQDITDHADDNCDEGFEQNDLASANEQVSSEMCDNESPPSTDNIPELDKLYVDSFNCPKCSKCFSRRENLEQHVKTHMDGQHVCCDQCGQKFNDKNALCNHKKSVHQKPNKDVKRGKRRTICAGCGSFYTDRVGFLQHLEESEICNTACKKYRNVRKRYDKRSMCSYCGKSIVATYMHEHVARHKDDKRYGCQTCGAKFCTSGKLREHSYTHSTEKPQCSICEKTYCHARALAIHVRRQHNNIDLKRHACDVCFKAFRDPYKLVQHQRTHTGEKPFSCSTCFRRFSCETSLVRHKRVHTGEKNFHCDTCGKSFSRKCYKRDHLLKQHNITMD